MSERMYRDKVVRLTKELADAQKKEREERGKLNKLLAESNKLRTEGARTTSASTDRSKESQGQSKDREAEQVQRRLSGYQATAARKLQDLTRAKADPEREETAARRKADQEDKKRREVCPAAVDRLYANLLDTFRV
jgi:hypothetical protein